MYTYIYIYKYICVCVCVCVCVCLCVCVCIHTLTRSCKGRFTISFKALAAATPECVTLTYLCVRHDSLTYMRHESFKAVAKVMFKNTLARALNSCHLLK